MRVADGLVVALGLLLAVGGCSKSADRPAPGASLAAPKAAAPAGDPCGAICERTRALACKRAGACADNCRTMLAVAGCKEEMAAVIGCFAREPTDHWECDDQGEPAIKAGFCDREQGRFVTCVEKRAAPGAPPRPL